MARIRRESALWGLVSALLFAVLALGYRLVTGADVPILLVLGVGAVVGVVTAVLSYLVASRLG
jgi:hypothetical protein